MTQRLVSSVWSGKRDSAPCFLALGLLSSQCSGGLGEGIWKGAGGDAGTLWPVLRASSALDLTRVIPEQPCSWTA